MSIRGVASIRAKPIALTASIGLFLATAFIVCSCSNVTRTGQGGISQGDRIEWSVSFEEAAALPSDTDIEYHLARISRGDEVLLYSLSASDKMDVWAAGLFGQIYRFDGSQWLGIGKIDIIVRSIYAFDGNHVWVGGEGFRADDEGVEEGTGQAVILFYDGSEWSEQLSQEEIRQELNGMINIDGSSPTNVWASSFSGIFHFDGQEWRAVYERGDGSPFDETNPDVEIRKLLVGEDGIPVVFTTKGFFYYENEKWHALPGLPANGSNFNCFGLSGSLSSGMWASGPIVNMIGEGERSREGAVYHYADGEWKTVYESNDGALGYGTQISETTFLVAKTTYRETSKGMGVLTVTMLYFDGSQWSEQGSIEDVMLWDAESTNGDTVWISDGKRVIRGEVKK